MTETGLVFDWRIENFSHWSKEVHGHCIKSPENNYSYFFNMELYPKGISGQGEHMVLRLHYTYSFSGELSFYSSNGSLLCSKQQVNTEDNTDVLELPPGPKFEDVLSRIREDFITVRLRIKNEYLYKYCISTTVNGLKISMKINPKWIEEMKSDETKDVCAIFFLPNIFSVIMYLRTISKNDIVHFLIKPPTNFEYPFAVEMCMSSTRSDGTVDSCVKKEHVFRDKDDWTFPNPLQKKELVGKEISLFLCLKTRNVIQSPFGMNWNYRYISIEFNNTSWFYEKPPSMNPDDSVQVLFKELMCLYQDRKFSDITLKCGNVIFPVHKNILSARSPVLDRMLYMKETASGTVDIGDLDPSTLTCFLTYLYTGAVEELQYDRAVNLYYAADKYQVPSLKKVCTNFLSANVSLSNVCDILSLAYKHEDVVLKLAAKYFVLKNYNQVLTSKEWGNLVKNEPSLVAETLTSFATKSSL